MPITTSCPGCKSLFRLPETLAGKHVRCQKCNQMFAVPLALGPGEDAPVEPAPIIVEKPPEPPPAPEAPEEIVPESRPTDPAPPATDVAPPKESAPVPPLPAETPPSLAWLTATLVLFVGAMLATGAAAGIWVGTHLELPSRVLIVPPFRGVHNKKDGFKDFRFEKEDKGFFEDKRKDGRFEKEDKGFFEDKRKDGRFEKDDKGFFEDKKNHPVEPTPINLDNGKALIQGLLQFHDGDAGRFGNQGPFRVYRMHLDAGKTYNFHVTGDIDIPRLRIFDGNIEVKSAVGGANVNRLLVSYQPARTGDHVLFLTASNFRQINFTLDIAPQQKTPPQRIKLDPQGKATQQQALSVWNPVDAAAFQYGPYRDYVVTLEAGRDYQFKIRDAAYLPVLRIYDGNLLLEEELSDLKTRTVEYVYRPARTADYRIRVTSEASALGAYTLEILTKKK